MASFLASVAMSVNHHQKQRFGSVVITFSEEILHHSLV